MSNLCQRRFRGRLYDRCRSLFVVCGVIEAFLHWSAVFLWHASHAFRTPRTWEIPRHRTVPPGSAVSCLASRVGNAPAGKGDRPKRGAHDVGRSRLRKGPPDVVQGSSQVLMNSDHPQGYATMVKPKGRAASCSCATQKSMPKRTRATSSHSNLAGATAIPRGCN